VRQTASRATIKPTQHHSKATKAGSSAGPDEIYFAVTKKLKVTRKETGLTAQSVQKMARKPHKQMLGSKGEHQLMYDQFEKLRTESLLKFGTNAMAAEKEKEGGKGEDKKEEEETKQKTNGNDDQVDDKDLQEEVKEKEAGTNGHAHSNGEKSNGNGSEKEGEESVKGSSVNGDGETEENKEEGEEKKSLCQKSAAASADSNMVVIE